MAKRDALEKLREHLANRQTGDVDTSSTEQELQDYASRLNHSLQSLQKQVDKNEAALLKLRQKVSQSPLDGPSSDRKQRLLQIRKVTVAYKGLVSADPALPSAKSPLPALLAVRSTLNLIDQSKKTIRDINGKLVSAEKDLHREKQSLEDTQYLTSALEGRIENLKIEEAEQAKMRAVDIASGLVTEQQNRRIHYAREMRGLVRAFNKFVNERLAAMLAAEDLGGPVVGDALDVTEDSLKGGYTQQGRPKKVAADSHSSDKKRSERNSQIWGDEYSLNSNGEIRSEKEAAAAAFRDLTENLLNAAAGADGSDSYVQVAKENAAVRFLVRAKVAHFHPEDARKLQLLDFGARAE